MLELLKTLHASKQFIPHGHCYLWIPNLVGLHILSDCLIALAYFSIPIRLLHFVCKPEDLPFNWMFLQFETFITSCGTTDILHLLNKGWWAVPTLRNHKLWHPTYWLSGCIKAINALISREKILSAGCNDFISKPFQESVLFDKMAEHLGVRYVYEDENHITSPPSGTIPRKLTPEDLSIMPPKWVAQLGEAVLCANDELILQLIEQIPETEANLAHVLTDFVNNFRLDLLFDLTDASTNE